MANKLMNVSTGERGPAFGLRNFQTMAEAILDALDNAAIDQAADAARRVWIYGDDGARTSYLYAELAQAGLCWAHWYRRSGICRGDVVFIGLPMSIDYIGALLGCILLGVSPCTVPFGTDPQGSNGALNNTVSAFHSIAPRLFVTTAEAIAQLHGRSLLPDSAVVHVTASERTTALPREQLPTVLPTDTHHLQLTSGSTAAPKAAVLSHESVCANINGTSDAMQGDAGLDVGCCWLPMFHDMGLMQLLVAMYQRPELVLQTPGSFLRNPMRWLERISEHRVTFAAAPAFAFTYCTRRFRGDIAEKLDLSCWRIAGVGAERVEHRVLREFSARYAPHGFSAASFYNCYGMAEAGLAVSMPVRPYSVTDDSETVPSVGMAVAGMEIQVRDEQGREVPESCQGEIYMRGSSLMSGYYRNLEASAKTFEGEWFRTGDLGYRKNGELYVLGRQKEIVVLRGRNYHPQEFEQCVAADPEVGMHRSVAIGVYREQYGTEGLVLLVEPRIVRGLPALRQSLQKRLRAQFGFGAEEIIFLQSGGIPRTTSHKVQRSRCRELYRSGELLTVVSEREAQAGGDSSGETVPRGAAMDTALSTIGM
jgi:acyl-CoA synthetase (AMP-forming)/AMP-acid ligase II